MERQSRRLWPEWSALILFGGLMAFAIPFHEPWADEAQAWQLARSLSLGALFKTYIRYEGSPGLWHFLLWILARMHVSYAGVHWLFGGVATAGVALLVFRSPLPRYLKLSLPFTYFLLFQYAVVARNYMLAPLLFFIVAMAWKRSPWVVALALGLLANLALHTAVLSGGLAVVYAIEQLWGDGAGERVQGRKLLLCAAALLAFYAFAIWTAWPPHDLGLARVRGDSTEAYLLSGIRSLVWGICQPPVLSAPFWVVIALWFAAQRKLLYLLPVLLFAVFSALVFVYWWHAGLLVPFLICVLWITWPEPGHKPFEFDTAGRVALGVMIATQILWSGYALYCDHYYAYSPDRAAAEFLKPYVSEGDRIAVTFVQDEHGRRGTASTSTGIQPYFDHNIYVNTPFEFWWWSDFDPSQERFLAVLPTHPRVVVVENEYIHPFPQPDLDHPVYALLEREGYEYHTTFCGTLLPPDMTPGPSICHVIFVTGDQGTRDQGNKAGTAASH